MNMNNDIDAIKIEFNENSTILDPEYHETTVVDKKNMEDLDATIINAPIVKDTIELFKNNLNPQVDNNHNYCSVFNLYESDLHPSNKTWITRNNSLSSVNSDQASLLTDDFFIYTENEHHDKNYDLLSYIKITKVESLSGRNNSWTETVDENNNEEYNIIYDIKKENFDYNDKTDESDKIIDEQNQFKKCIEMAASSTPVNNTSPANNLLVSNDNFKNNQISSVETRLSNQNQIKVEGDKNSFESFHHIPNISKSFLPIVLLERIEVPEKVIETSNSVMKTHEKKLTKVLFKSKTNKPVDSEKPLKNYKRHRGIGERSCKECGYLARSKYYLNIHMRKHSHEKSMQCPECPLKTSYKSNLTFHMRRFHPDQMVSCKFCDSKFITANDLREHMRIHTKRNPITCDICKKTFGNFFFLKRHMISHSEEKPHECPECPFKTSYKSSLTGHMRRFHPDQMASCKFCDSKFITANDLREHMRIHTENTCDICKKKFRNLYNLKQHMIYHSEERPYECNICHNEFKRADDLTSHLGHAHS